MVEVAAVETKTVETTPVQAELVCWQCAARGQRHRFSTTEPDY